MRPVSLWSCAHVRVSWIRAGGAYRETSLQTLSGAAFFHCVRLIGTGSLGLRRQSTTPASVPGPVWLSATSHRACPR